MSSDRKPGPCATCKVVPHRHNSPYCPACANARAYAWKVRAGRISGIRMKPKKFGVNSCNCGTQGCSGLTCDSLRYGTAS